MATFLHKTKGEAIKGKARVYFTCHPDDFDRSFDKICADIFKTQGAQGVNTHDLGDLLHRVVASHQIVL